MTKASREKLLFKVKFQEKGDDAPVTVTVEKFYPNEILGFITLEGFTFKDEPKLVLLPEEDAVRKRFANTKKLHLPYHVLLSVEEFVDGDTGGELTVVPSFRSEEGQNLPTQ